MTIRYWSDLHISHKNIYKFRSIYNPTKYMRPFSSMEECEQVMVDNYNKVVESDDIVYFIGDVWMDKKGAPVLSKMKKGSKRLIMGNHDNKGDVAAYREYFDKVHGAMYFNKIQAMSAHFPIHPRFLGKEGCDPSTVRFTHNLHGHTHDSYVRREDGTRDPRYLNCCVEAVNFTPRTIEELISYTKISSSV